MLSQHVHFNSHEEVYVYYIFVDFVFYFLNLHSLAIVLYESIISQVSQRKLLQLVGLIHKHLKAEN